MLSKYKYIQREPNNLLLGQPHVHDNSPRAMFVLQNFGFKAANSLSIISIPVFGYYNI